MNLRKKVNEDLETSLEKISEWGLPVELMAPDGTVQKLKKDTPDKLTGQVLYNSLSFNPDTGEEIVINDPVVTLRLNSLDRIPIEGEKWGVMIPEEPDPDANMVLYALTPSKAMKFNRSFGWVRMYLSKVIQL